MNENMQPKKVESVLKGVRDWGYRERVLTLVSEGDWTAKDAEWNYLDVPHLNEVHSQARTETFFYGHQCTSSVLNQKVGPFEFLSVLTIYASGPNELSYSSSIGPILLIVQSKWQDIGINRARVETIYHIFAPTIFRWTLKLIEKILKRNYFILMSEDLPLRERKGKLRKQGFSFKHDNSPHSFLDSRNIATNNVVLPKEISEQNYKLSISSLTDGQSYFLGSDDINGLRLEKNGSQILLGPRMCMHEGACLDEVKLDSQTLRCPWHGRKIRMFATIQIEPTSPTEVSPGLIISQTHSELTIKWLPLNKL
jgi:hypothetical protein